jgi:predicted 3-demethylubiquinone-9 3-methyltransferase (glyoxalase superfamily)
MNIIRKITPNLWFDSQAEGAVNFYTSVFRNSGIRRTTLWERRVKFTFIKEFSETDTCHRDFPDPLLLYIPGK